MAGNSTKEVDLVIRAKDLSAKALKDSKDAITEVTSALEDQAKIAQKTGASMDELQKGAASLAKAEGELVKQQGNLDKALTQTATSMDRAVGREKALGDQLERLNTQLADQVRHTEAAESAWELFSRDMLAFGPPAREASKQLQSVANEMQRSGTAADKLRSDIANVQSSMFNAKTATQQLAAIQNELSTAQQRVAVAVKDSTAAQASQKAAVVAAAEAQRQAAAAAKERAAAEKTAAEEARRAQESHAAALDRATKGQRESLSWYQRVRGEVIALATAYVGLQGAIGIAKDALDAFQSRQGSLNVLSIVVGDTDVTKVGQEFNYVRDVADRLGFRLKDLVKQYGQFAVAARAAGASSQETRFIFEKVAESIRGLNLNAEESKGVFLAIQQMFSKGKITAEELRQQLGERLPGAVAILAKSLGVTTGALDKMMQKGEVGADKILNLARGMEQAFGKGVQNSVQSLNAEMGRFQTALDDFKLSIADGGFAAAFTKFLKDLTVFFKSDDGKKLAQSLSDGFTKVVGALDFVVKHFNDLKDLLLLILTIKFGAMLIGLAETSTRAAIQLIEMNAALAAAGPAGAAGALGINATTTASRNLLSVLGSVSKMLTVVTAALTGWEIGTILDQKFESIHNASIAVARGITDAFIRMKFGVVVIAAEMSEAVTEWFSKAVDKINDLKNGFLGATAKLADKMGFDGVATEIRDGIKKGMADGVTEGGMRVAAWRAKLAAQQARDTRDAELAINKAKFDEMRSGVGGVRAVLTKPRPGQSTEDPGKSTVEVTPPDDSKLIAKREKMEESLAAKLNEINRKVEKTYTDSLDERVEATKRSFADIEKTMDKFAKLGGTEVGGVPLDEIRKQVAALKEEAVAQQTVKFNTEAITKAEKNVNDLIAERAARIAEVTSDQKAGAIDAATAYERIKKINEDMVPLIGIAADGAKKFAENIKEAGNSPTLTNKLDALIAKMQRISSGADVSGQHSNTAQEGQQVFNQAMTEANNVLAQRNALVTTYNDLVKLGEITQLEANQKIKAAFEATQPQIDKAVEGMKALLASMASDNNIPTEKLAALSAQLQLLQVNARAVDTEMVAVKNAFQNSFSSGFQNTVNGLGDALVGLATGTKSWGDALKSVANVALSALGSIAQAVANAITQMIALRIVSSIFGAMGGGMAAGVEGSASFIGPPTPVRHSGGLVGNSMGNRVRAVSAAVFANAPRYHSGTVVGLRPDEQQAILQKGEEVLSKDNPRNIMNQTADNARSGNGLAIRNVLVTDPSLVTESLQSAQGEKTLITFIGKNRGKIRKTLGF